LQARYVAGDYPVAMEASAKAQRLFWTLSGFFDEGDYHFHGSRQWGRPHCAF
jgi:hypothetical protein